MSGSKANGAIGAKPGDTAPKHISIKVKDSRRMRSSSKSNVPRQLTSSWQHMLNNRGEI